MSYSHVGRFGDSFSKLTPGGSHHQALDDEGAAALLRPSRAAIAEKLIEQAQLQADLEFMSYTIRPEGSCMPPGGTLEEQKIGIIGGGIAGLYAALILDSLNLTNYQILEAHPSRAGGRVCTHYFQDKCSKSWDYVDLGAMRIPTIKIMDRLIGPEPWSLINFLNSSIKDPSFKVVLLDYELSDPNNIMYYNSSRVTVSEYNDRSSKDPLHFGKRNKGGLDDMYVQKKYTYWVDLAFDDLKELLGKDFDKGFRKLMQLDHLSVRAYMRSLQKCNFPSELVDYLETLDSATSLYNDALTEAIMDSFDFDAPGWKCVEGGMSRIIDAMVHVIHSKPQFDKKVTKISPSKVSQGDIDVYLEIDERCVFNHVINTLPPSVMRSIDTSECNFSYMKRTALRAVHMDSCVKIGLVSKSRWWRNECVMKGKPIKSGGQSSTDLPIRTIVYPSYGNDDVDAAGVLIASYTWAQDAARISALAASDPEGLLESIIKDLAMVHDVPLDYLREEYNHEDFFIIKDWQQFEYSQGAFGMFGPSQFATLFPGLRMPEMNCRYHTAGEVSSVHHGWIVGALNSAWRCVFEILAAHGRMDKIKELVYKWGELEDVERGSGAHLNSSSSFDCIMNIMIVLLQIIEGKKR